MKTQLRSFLYFRQKSCVIFSVGPNNEAQRQDEVLKKIKNYEFYETIAGTVTRTVVLTSFNLNSKLHSQACSS